MDKQRKIDILKDFIRLDTIGGNEVIAADYIENLLKEVGISSRRVNYAENRDQLIAYLNDDMDGTIMGLSGHMDVVPPGDVEWKYPPLGAVEEDGKIYGRGTTDMKSGLIAMVIAMMELKEEGVKLNGNVKLLATVGEETSAIGAGQLVELGEAEDLDALLIGEPSTEKAIMTAHKGALWPRITTYGKTAHGSMPENGVNALDHMILLINRLNQKLDFSDQSNAAVGHSTTSFNVMNSGHATNVIPDVCTIEYDIRTIAGQDHGKIKKIIQDEIDKLTKEVPDFKADVVYINDLLGIETDVNEKIIKCAQEAGKKNFGLDEVIGLGGSGYTDASQFVKAKKKFPITVYGPGVNGLAHQPNEYVEIDQYLKFIDVYKDTVKSFLD